MGAGLSVGLAGLAAGFAIGIVGDAGVRGTAQQPRLFIGMVSKTLFLIFGLRRFGRKGKWEEMGTRNFLFENFCNRRERRRWIWRIVEVERGEEKLKIEVRKLR